MFSYRLLRCGLYSSSSESCLTGIFGIGVSESLGSLEMAVSNGRLDSLLCRSLRLLFHNGVIIVVVLELIMHGGSSFSNSSERFLTAVVLRDLFGMLFRSFSGLSEWAFRLFLRSSLPEYPLDWPSRLVFSNGVIKMSAEREAL